MANRSTSDPSTRSADATGLPRARGMDQRRVGPRWRSPRTGDSRGVVDREYDQVLRMWMPHGSNFVLFQPHLRNVAGVLRGTIGYGSPTIARVWLDR